MHDPLTNGFDLLAPARWTAPLVFNSPHSGSQLPDAFLAMTTLTENQLHMSEDCYVDQLFSGCVEAGAPLMRCLFSRSFLDLNREPHEFDARMFNERLPAYINTSSPRVASGLGTIPRTVGDGLLIYNKPLELAEALNRIECTYRPYHRALCALLDESHRATSIAVLVDCHSMPSSAVSHYRTGPLHGVDVVLGDRFGSSCDAGLVDLVEKTLQNAGLQVSRNKPYSGGFFTENHGRPRAGRHALQIELGRALYMNETSHEKNAGFGALKSVLDDLAQKMAGWIKHEFLGMGAHPAQAAE